MLTFSEIKNFTKPIWTSSTPSFYFDWIDSVWWRCYSQPSAARRGKHSSLHVNIDPVSRSAARRRIPVMLGNAIGKSRDKKRADVVTKMSQSEKNEKDLKECTLQAN